MASNHKDEVPCRSLENLNLQDQADTSPSQSPTEKASSAEPSPLILCDAWYGFPTQKRPRRERILAVSRQLVNFIEWRRNAKLDTQYCQVQLLGDGSDVDAVQDRVNEIASEEFSYGKDCSEVVFKPNIDIHEALQMWRQQHNTDDQVVYLSPDASETLSSSSRPPNIVVVGMLIDRRITSDRSRKRAEETLNLRAVKLPLDVLNVKEMNSEEPLNVDTVMELMQRWWANCDTADKQLAGAVDSSKYKQCFVQAAAWAMKSHRERHPNRTVHKS